MGPDRTKHLVHQALLVESSEYFKKALSGRWSESEDGVELADVECDTCEYIYLRSGDGSLCTVRFWDLTSSLAYQAFECT
jgi:hypothetical protein